MSYPHQPYGGGMQCPRCRAPMRSYPRSGVQIERCDQCRGIFLDEGELETLTRNEAQFGPGGMPPPGYGGYQGGYPGGYQGGYQGDPNNQGGYGGSPYPGYGPYGGEAWHSADPNNPAPPPDQYPPR